MAVQERAFLCFGGGELLGYAFECCLSCLFAGIGTVQSKNCYLPYAALCACRHSNLGGSGEPDLGNWCIEKGNLFVG